MGNRKARELRLKQDRDATWDRLRREPWRPDDPRRAFGSGTPRVQVISLPSFSPAAFWEVCERGSEWVLYRADVVSDQWPAVAVRGYDPVAFPSDILRGYFDRLVAVAVPVAPHLNKMAGVDGTTTRLTLFGDLHSHVRFEWWSDYPPGWTPLVGVVEQMLEAFPRPKAAEGQPDA